MEKDGRQERKAENSQKYTKKIKDVMSLDDKVSVVTPENIPIEIVYEDDYLMVVVKPAGMVAHPVGQYASGTLANALLWHYKDLPVLKDREEQPGLVHRIDKYTSGLLVVAKTVPAMKSLLQQFYDHTIERTYVAMVWGDVTPEAGTIDINIGRHESGNFSTIHPDNDEGKTAITHYKVLKAYGYSSLVQCSLETGRTHQIRVHMKHIGHPLIKDHMYGGSTIPSFCPNKEFREFAKKCLNTIGRQALHAKTLGFIHPDTGEQMHFDSNLPPDFLSLLDLWEQYD